MVAYSKGMPIGPAPSFSLPGVDGQTHSLESFRDARCWCVVFTCNHCPYALALEPRFIELRATTRAVACAWWRSIRTTPVRIQRTTSRTCRLARETTRGTFRTSTTKPGGRAALRRGLTPDVCFDAKRTLRYNGRVDATGRTASGSSSAT